VTARTIAWSPAFTSPPGASRLRVALSAGGYALTIFIVVLALPIVGPYGDVGRLFDPIGDAFRAGQPVYVPADTPFFYAPPWVVVLGVLSILPVPVFTLGLWALNLGSLRIMAGSWLAVGWLMWLPIVGMSLLGATFNLAMAAAIYLGAAGIASPAVAMAFAKISPILAVPFRAWRETLLITAVLVGITIPWLSLWPQWVAQLTAYAGSSIGPQIPIPYALRLAAVVPLLLVPKPWARGLAATLAIPAFYWESVVVLLAPLCLYLRRPRPADVADVAAAPTY
jgi:hypothetical protein